MNKMHAWKCSLYAIGIVMLVGGCDTAELDDSDVATIVKTPAITNETPSEVQAPAATSVTPAELQAQPRGGLSDDRRAQMEAWLDEVPDVVARVDGTEIPKAEFATFLENTLRFIDAQAQFVGGSATATAFVAEQGMALLTSYVESHALLQLAEKAGTEVTPDKIEERIASGRANLGTANSYSEYLAWFGMSEAELREKIHGDLMRDEYVSLRAGECVATDEEVGAIYAQLKAVGRIKQPETTDFWVISISLAPDADDNDKAGALAKVTVARERIEAGEDFDVVARDVSDDPRVAESGGLLTGLTRQVLIPEIAAVAFDGEAGTLSDPISSSFGWHLVRPKSVTPAGDIPLSDITETLRDSMLIQCKQTKYRETLTLIRKEIEIEILYKPTDE